MLEICLIGMGGGFCYMVGDVVICIIFFFMNDYDDFVGFLEGWL